MKRDRDRGGSALRVVAAVLPALAAFPSAFFVGRSAWYHLVQGWHVQMHPLIGIVVGVGVGVVVEGLGTVAIFLASTLGRWNREKAILESYKEAPAGLAKACVVAYFLATVVLLALLEGIPALAAYATMVFPVLTVVGGVCWSLMDQHQDRLSYHGLEWNWVARQITEPETIRAIEPEPLPEIEPKPELGPLERVMVDTWREDPGATLEQVADVLKQSGFGSGTSKSSVSRRFKNLEQLGVLDRTDQGVLVQFGTNGNG